MSNRTGRRAAALATSTLMLAALIGIAGCNTAGKLTGEQSVQATMQVCASCHGADGRSISPTFPRLAGQQAEYLEVQLEAFRDKTRADPHAHTYMWGMAAKLTDDTIKGLATAFAAMPPAPGEPDNSAEAAAGAAIFRDGVPARDVPACQACHQEHAEGAGAIPRLAGQHRPYIEEQLAAFSSNARANEIMHDNSKNLTATEIAEVGAFVASQ